MLDVLMKNGTVVDGTGEPAFSADVGVEAGRVTTIGELSHAEAFTVLDATGLVVSPGFIDIHSHSDFTLLIDPRAQSAIAQGVTTELIGNCGHGAAPMRDLDAAKGNIYLYDPSVPITWTTMAGYLERLQQLTPAVNVLTLVPNGMMRIAVMGYRERRAEPHERDQVRDMLIEGLEAGAIGFSTGLEYPIERACAEDEVTELLRVVARYDGLYAPHLRNRDLKALEALEEAVRTARTTGVRLHVPHLAPKRGGAADTDLRLIERIDGALADKQDVSVDMHTRLHGTANVSVALPPWALEGGPEELRRRLRDPATRAQIDRYDSMMKSGALGGWDHIRLLKSTRRPDLIGKSFQEIGDSAGTTPFDALLDLLLEEADDPHSSIYMRETYTEPQLRRFYEHPVCCVTSDSAALCVDGPLAEAVFLGSYTWASWFFRRMVREECAFSLPEAVRKLTKLPAQRLGLHKRGILSLGAWADIVVFNPNIFGERGTLFRSNQLAQGMVHVLVNGVIAMQDGHFSGKRAGRVLRRLHLDE